MALDAFSCKTVGWAMADRLRTELILDAVGMAIARRLPEPGTIHNYDRGTQYTSCEFGKSLRASGVLASMGRVGSASENAMVETTFATLKSKLAYRRAWSSRHELEMGMEVFFYTEGFYNTRRRHSRLDD